MGLMYGLEFQFSIDDPVKAAQQIATRLTYLETAVATVGDYIAEGLIEHANVKGDSYLQSVGDKLFATLTVLENEVGTVARMAESLDDELTRTEQAKPKAAPIARATEIQRRNGAAAEA